MSFSLSDFQEKPKLVCVVKISSSYYRTKRGIAYQRRLDVLKRKSTLHIDEILYEPAEYPPINFNDVDDGIYELTVTNISKDWESGMIDDWDVELIPYADKGGE